MQKLKYNKPLLFSLITAILFLQWSTTHFHLIGDHEHDSGQHQHEITAHKHQLVSHHADVIDVALSHVDSHKVVELEHVCAQFHGKLAKLYTVVPYTLWNALERQISFKRIAISYQQDVYQTYHQYTSIQLRAPPIIS